MSGLRRSALRLVTVFVLLVVLSGLAGAVEVCSGCVYSGTLIYNDSTPPFLHCVSPAIAKVTIYAEYRENCYDPDTGVSRDRRCYLDLLQYSCSY